MNKTLHDLGMDALRQVRSQMHILITDPAIKPASVGSAARTYTTTRAAAYTMLIEASDSNPGYEAMDLPRETKSLLAEVDRLIEIGIIYADAKAMA